MVDTPPLRIATSAAGVRTLTFDRPARRNAIDGTLADAMEGALADAARDQEVRVVVITGAGPAFCAGLDLATAATLAAAMRDAGDDPYAWVGRWILAVVGCEKPVIAAVNGAAVGAGLGLALACDVRLLAASAQLTAGYVSRGLSPDAGVSHFLPRHVGLARATEILLSGRAVTAEEAVRIGLAAEVHADAGFAAAVEAYAERLAAGPPLAYALTKRLLQRSLESPLDAALRAELAHITTCFASRDGEEALAAFREKRPPRFRGS